MAVVEAVKAAEFRILGPVTVLLEGTPAPLGGPKQRALLAALLLRAGTPVAIEELIDAVWGDAPPPTASKSVQVSVTNLRRLLGHERIRTHGSAYAIEVADGELDARHFEQLAAEGHEALTRGDYAAAGDALTPALALWRGRVCEGVAFESHVNADAERLEELHRAALRDRVEADLALGRHAQLVPELERLVAQHPLDEELRAQQMLALYRSGRQGDALRVYQDARALLVEQLGVEPGERLRVLQRRILDQDPRLDAPTAVPASQQTPEVRSRRRYLFAAGAVVAVAAVTGVALGVGVGSAGSHSTIASDSVGVLDVGSGDVDATASAGPEPSAIAYRNGTAWVADSAGDTVMRIGGDGRVADRIGVGGNVTGVAATRDAVWALSGERRRLYRIDPGIDKVVRSIGVGNGPRAVVAGLGAIWVANGVDGTLSRVDPDTGHVSTIPVGGTPNALAVGDGAVWVANSGTNEVLRLDPASDVITAISVGHGPDAIAADNRSVWVANGLDGTASRIDPTTNSVRTTVQVEDPTAVALDGAGVWIGSGRAGTVTEFDPRTGDSRRKTRIGDSPSALAAAGQHLWVAAVASPASRRGGTLRLVGNTGDLPLTFDPALDFAADSWQVLAVTNDGLLTYRRSGGVAGSDLVPDLAQSIPPARSDGRSYTFRLRPHIRYSDGRLVRASDVRASIERIFELHSQTIGAFTLGLVGEAACAAGKSRCDLSRGIVTDDRTGTVTFHLTRRNPDFLKMLAVPTYDVLPAGTPAGAHVATGPYLIVSFRKGRLLLARNPRFREWSAAAQPQGFPDRIVWNLKASAAKGGREVLAGRADVLAPAPPNLASLAVGDPALLHSERNGFVQYLFLNTRVAPFNNLDARRAVNLGTNRARARTVYGGPFLAEPTCEVLPPNLPGYQPYCPYTLHPSGAGAWSAPAFARAKQLVARSGTKGQRVTVWTMAGRPSALAIGRSVVALLRSLGYHASVVPVGGGSQHYYSVVTRPGAQIGVFDWTGIVPSPSDYLLPLASCAAAPTDLSHFCDPRIDRMMARREWEAADRALVNQAPLVPLVADRQANLVSHRVGNYEYNAALGGVLIDELWLRLR